jgi:sucrose phosphorylase
LRFRNTCQAFGFDAQCTVADTTADRLAITWSRNGHTAELLADLGDGTFSIKASDAEGRDSFAFVQ